MTGHQAATGVAREGTPADSWDDHREILSGIRSQIEDAEDELQQLYDSRSEAVADAWSEGMPQREIGYELGISHTMVQKILGGEMGTS